MQRGIAIEGRFQFVQFPEHRINPLKDTLLTQRLDSPGLRGRHGEQRSAEWYLGSEPDAIAHPHGPIPGAQLPQIDDSGIEPGKVSAQGASITGIVFQRLLVFRVGAELIESVRQILDAGSWFGRKLEQGPSRCAPIRVEPAEQSGGCQPCPNRIERIRGWRLIHGKGSPEFRAGCPQGFDAGCQFRQQIVQHLVIKTFVT